MVTEGYHALKEIMSLLAGYPSSDWPSHMPFMESCVNKPFPLRSLIDCDIGLILFLSSISFRQRATRKSYLYPENFFRKCISPNFSLMT